MISNIFYFSGFPCATVKYHFVAFVTTVYRDYLHIYWHYPINVEGIRQEIKINRDGFANYFARNIKVGVVTVSSIRLKEGL